ncbi:Uncharacterised protein [Mycobacteroides abscessus subsp. abscessus]|nr:Uncharacterised protein [Mycobacteroides abscessus subsp. abscessus]
MPGDRADVGPRRDQEIDKRTAHIACSAGDENCHDGYSNSGGSRWCPAGSLAHANTTGRGPEKLLAGPVTFGVTESS